MQYFIKIEKICIPCLSIKPLEPKIVHSTKQKGLNPSIQYFINLKEFLYNVSNKVCKQMMCRPHMIAFRFDVLRSRFVVIIEVMTSPMERLTVIYEVLLKSV